MAAPNRLRSSVLVLVVAIVFIVALGLWSTARTASSTAWVEHTVEVQKDTEGLLRTLLAIESKGRLFAINGDPRVRDEVRGFEQQALQAVDRLATLTRDEPEQQQRIAELRRRVQAKRDFAERLLAAREQGGREAALVMVSSGEGEQLISAADAELNDISGSESKLLGERERAVRQAVLATSAVIALTGVLLVIAAVLFLRRLAAEADARERAMADVRASEQRLRLLTAQVRDYAILLVDAQGRVESWNPGAGKLYGFEERAIVGQPLATMDLEPGTSVRALAEAARTGRFEAELERLRADGTRVWTSTIIVPILESAGRLRGYVEVSRDVSARRAFDLERAELITRLERSNAELQEFAMIASHDLQEPLRKIRMFGDRLREDHGEKLGDEGRDFLGRMESAAARGQQLIDGLLAFSRVTTRAQEPEPVDLGTVAREVTSDLEERLRSSGGEIRLGALPVLDADPLQMRQLFQNLFANALKFRREGVPPIVRVTSEQVERSPARWRVEVADNGIGFEPQFANKLFRLFQRLHGRQQYAGSGVGLAVCRKIVERHGGTISVRSTPGEGTTFQFELPEHQRAGEGVDDGDDRADRDPDGGRRRGRPDDDASGVRASSPRQ